jgi:hypothetical protein
MPAIEITVLFYEWIVAIGARFFPRREVDESG